jgi:hypothetical protein
VGSSAIYAIRNTLSGGALVGNKIDWIGIDAGLLASFGFFWALHPYFVTGFENSTHRLAMQYSLARHVHAMT